LVKKETKEEMDLMVYQEDLDPLEKMDSLVTMVNQDCKGQLDYLGVDKEHLDLQVLLVPEVFQDLLDLLVQMDMMVSLD
jgi:hypothetical protein